MTAGVRELARAKVNLTLHVGATIETGKWAGYHPVESLVVFADFGDVLQFETRDEWRANYIGPFSDNFSDVEEGQNSVLQALEMCGQSQQSFTLDKQIPMAAGLGGGTADAAAVLRVFDKAQNIDLTNIGADGPVCHLSHTAMMEGIGEQITTQPGLGQISAVLINPGMAVSTGLIFEALDAAPRPHMPAVTARTGDLLSRALSGDNDMQEAAISHAPVISDVLRSLAQQASCELARMSGSGATCFGIFRSDAAASAAAKKISEAQPDWWVRACRLGDRPEDKGLKGTVS